jgi:hypothetical protein
VVTSIFRRSFDFLNVPERDRALLAPMITPALTIVRFAWQWGAKLFHLSLSMNTFLNIYVCEMFSLTSNLTRTQRVAATLELHLRGDMPGHGDVLLAGTCVHACVWADALCLRLAMT